MAVIAADGHEGLLQSSVESFHHPVCFGMISRRHIVLYSPGFEKLRPDCGGELTPPVSGDDLGDSETANPAM